VLVLGGGGVAAYLLTRPASTTEVPVDAREAIDPDEPDPDEDGVTPDAAPRDPDEDPWAGGLAPSPSTAKDALSGDTIDVGQGARFQVPPGFIAQRSDAGAVAMDSTRGVFFGFAPIGDTTSDPKVLAKNYARTTGLELTHVATTKVQGEERPYAILEGVLEGTPVRHVVIAFLSPRYRLAMIVHVPQALGQDRALQELVTEAAERRLQLP